MGLSGILWLLFGLFLSVSCSSKHLLCSNSRPPSKLDKPLEFCSYNGISCCDNSEDEQIKNQFYKMNVSDPACASLLKSILCAKCDQYSGKLFKAASGSKDIPILCTSKDIEVLPRSQGRASTEFCTKVWDTCRGTWIRNSPFAPAVHGGSSERLKSSASQLTDEWKSREDFCGEFGGAIKDGAVCFNGGPVSLANVESTKPFEGLCIEKVVNETYLVMIPHPDGSNRVFFGNMQGKIWVADIPDQGSNMILEIDKSKPFIDVADYLLYDTEFGLLSMAFHPNFKHNGRIFMSFSCDKLQQPNCMGRCSCNTDVNCDPSTLKADSGTQPCQYHNVIGEFTVNTASGSLSATGSKTLEVRRILTIGLPYRGVHGGQILFGPKDGYLYCMIGDGSRRDDPYNLSQNKKSPLGKILRLDVDKMPNEREINELALWGNYSIPKDNPYVDDKELAPEIYALGFRNPWRCSFDSERPSYLLCGDVGQEEYEEIDMVIKGGNYGWRVYEGPYPFLPKSFPGGNTSASSIKPVFPVIFYNHSQTDNKMESASAIGGYFYRSMTDPCLYGRYIFSDLYGQAIFVATEGPGDRRNFTSELIQFRCAHDSPMNCSLLAGSSVPALGYVLSLGEDNKKDIYFLTTTGVYRVVEPSRCNFGCSSKAKMKEKFAPRGPNPSPTPAKSSGYYHSADITFLIFSLTICIVLNFVR